MSEDKGVYKAENKKDYERAPWEDEMEKGDFVSYAPCYNAGEYFNRFEKYSIITPVKGIPFKMDYYLFNPIKYGADPNRKYPLLTFFHGATNALNGELCINYCGGELYASPEYQEKMGGAFVLIPIANEYKSDDGQCQGGWWEPVYTSVVCNLFEKLTEEYNANFGKKIIFGNSAGGCFVWSLAKKYPDYFDALVPIGGSGLPNEHEFKAIEKHGTNILVMHGLRDELVSFKKYIKPYANRLSRTKNCTCVFLEWVRNSDGGVASINFGFEMGQHCLVNAMQENMMFQSGKPMCRELPQGITGWIKSIL